MIKNLKLTDFQAHANTFIEFDNGVNALVGLSDSGKTAVLRGLRWLCFNQPDGDEFISHWADSVEVQGALDNGTIITRGRGKTGNWYRMEIPGQKPQEFKAFGRGQVPQEIQDALNLNPEINLSRQMDGPFLLSMSPGEVAQTLNRVVNLDIIDTAISNVRKKKMEADRELKSCQGRKSQLEEQLTGFAYLEDMESDILVLESLQGALQQNQEKISGIRNIQRQIEKTSLELVECSNLLPADKTVKAILGRLDELEQLETRRKGLARLVNQIYDCEDSIKKIGNVVDAQVPVEKLLARVKEMETKQEQLKGLQKLKKEIEALKWKIKRSELDEIQYQQEFDALMPEQCPLCGQEVV